MEPNFVINTVVSERDYRRGLRDSVEKRSIIIWISIFVLMIIRTIGEMVNYGYYYRLPYKYLIMSILFIGLCVYFIFKHWSLPDKIAQQNIDMLVLQTGSAELNNMIRFYDYEVTDTSLKTNKTFHIPYPFINKIVEYDSFIMLLGRQGSAVYISKSDIPDYHGFMNYIIYKCPAAKIRRKIVK